MTNTYNLYRNVDEEQALERLDSMTMRCVVSRPWIQLYLATDKWYGNFIYAQGRNKNIIIAESSCKGIAKMAGPMSRKPWVARVRFPCSYLAASSVPARAPILDRFQVYDVYSSTGNDGMYVADDRCSLFFSKPRSRRPVDVDKFATVRGQTVSVGRERERRALAAPPVASEGNAEFDAFLLALKPPAAAAPLVFNTGDPELDALMRQLG